MSVAPQPEVPTPREEPPAPAVTEPPPVPAVAEAPPVPAVAELPVSASPLPKNIVSDNDAPVRASYLRTGFSTTSASLTVRLVNEALGVDLTVPCEPGEFVLDATERAGFELPSSCRNGGCLTCAALQVSGESAITEEQYTLEEEHVAQGFRLLCCTVVTKDTVFLTHQQDEIH